MFSKWYAMSHQRPVLKVLIADDHPLVLQGLIDVLRSYPDLHIVAQCKDGELAAEKIKALEPDIAILDMAMPGLTGVEVVASVRAFVRTKFVLLTASATDRQILLALDEGVSCILHKDGAFEEIIDGIRDAAAGRQRLSPSIADVVARNGGAGRSIPNPEERLTKREQEIVALVAKSLSNKEIARELHLSEGTVKIHLHRIFQKLHITNRTALATLMINNPDQLEFRTQDLVRR
jgi:two-component system nitrate/nitrite response regulator NarL